MFQKKFYKKKIIKTILKGYRIFKRDNHIDNFYNFEIDIEKYTNNLNNKYTLIKDINLNFSYNQYLIRSLLTSRFKIYYLFFLGLGLNLIFPLPLEWFKFIKKNKIKMNFVFSFLFYLSFCFFALLKNFYQTIRYIFIEQNKNFPKHYDFLIGFNNKFYFPNNKNKNLNIVDYLDKEIGLTENVLYDYEFPNSYYHNRNLYFSKNLFCLTFIQKINLLIYILFLFIKSFILFFGLNFKYSILFFELVLLKKIKLFNKHSNLADKYIFNLSFGNFRPLWTYFLENNNSKIYFINYASGFYGIKNIYKDQYPKQLSLGFNCMNWPNYIIDKKLYYDFLILNYPNKNFILSNNQVDISDSGIALPKFDKRKFTIGILDVSPIRKFLRLLYLPQDNFRTSEICIKILSDIDDVLNNFDVNILFKKKRSAISRDCKRYHNYADKLKFINIDPSVSATRMSNACDLLIAVPFTTAAFNLNKNQKLNSIFYSPYEIISKSDRAAQKLSVIIGKKELYKFIDNEINSIN